MGGYVGIPASYTPVEYIESSGTQYIDTGFKHNQNTRMVADLSFSDVSSWSYPFGSFGGTRDTPKLFCAEIDDAQHLGSYFGSVQRTSIAASGRHSFDLNKNVHKIDNNTYTFSATTMQSGYNDLIFGVTGYDGNANLPRTKIKLYSFKLYDNGTLIRDFIPVIDRDNVACLYDLVEGKFYYNQGTGSFTAGSTTGSEVIFGDKARRIARGYVGVQMSYTPVEYIESSGTQYIDTGFKHNQNTRMVAKFEVDDYRVWVFLFGSYGGANAYPRKLLGVDVNNSGKFGSYYGHSYESFNINALGIHEFDFNKNIHTIDNETKTYSAQTFQSQFNDLIFGATNYTGGISISTDSLKLYYFKIYDNDVLVRDFIPVVDGNNVACLYEQVEGKFYYNKGTGTFTAGSVTGQAVSLGSKARKIIKGYVGVGGVARQVFA